MTRYIVFRKGTEDDLWSEGVTTEARSAKAAVQSALLNSTEGGTFVAVPARSFRPVTVKVETKTALKFS